MAAALPVTKLATLFVKSLAKPVSKRIKHEFSRYETTQNLLIAIGQTSHQITSRLTIWSAGYKVRSITPLDNDKAMKTGSEFVGESFILFVSVTTLLYEYNRSKEKEKVKNEKARAAATAERRDLQAKLRALDLRIHALEKSVEKNNQSVITILRGGYQTYEPPDKDKLVPIISDEEENDLDNNNDINQKSIGNNGAPVNEKSSSVLPSSSPTTTTSSSCNNNNNENPSKKPWWRILW